MTDVIEAVGEKDKKNGEDVQKDMKILDNRKDKIRNFERRLDDFTRACSDFHDVEKELEVDLGSIKRDVITEIERALKM